MQPNNKNKPVWVTIPEKSAEESLPKSTKKISNPDVVKNKLFWAMGFVAVLFFGFILAMPSTFSNLMKGDLFDGGFEFIPSEGGDVNDAFFGETDYEEVEPTEADELLLDDEGQLNPSASESEAELIDIDPISTPEETDEPEPVVLDDEPVPEPEDESDEISAELLAMIENLNAQLEALREDGLKKDQEIQSLMELLESQAAQHQAASKQEPSGSQSNENSDQSVVTAAGYKVNTHTVNQSPEEVLAERQAGGMQAGEMLQADVSSADSAQPTAPQQQTIDLSGVNAQPTTGPMESVAFAFLLASLGVLGYGAYRRVRA